MVHRALITGVTGFAGGFLAQHLIDCGDVVLGCSTTGQWRPNSAMELASGVELVAWDIGQSDGMTDEARRQIADFQPDRVYHLAALSVPEACGGDRPTPQAIAINVDGMRRVLELAAALPSRPRVIAISSSHVYAPVGSHDCRLDETAPAGPLGGYGQTKLAAEEEVHRAIVSRGVDAVIVRPFQHAGPRQNSRMMLAQWTSQFAGDVNNYINVYTCDAFIDLSDVRDVVRAYRLLAERGRSGEVYNVGSGVCRRSGDVLELLRRAAGSSRQVIERRPGVKHDPIADITRVRDATGWQPIIPLETTVADTLAWWQTARV